MYAPKNFMYAPNTLCMPEKQNRRLTAVGRWLIYGNDIRHTMMVVMFSSLLP